MRIFDRLLIAAALCAAVGPASADQPDWGRLGSWLDAHKGADCQFGDKQTTAVCISGTEMANFYQQTVNGKPSWIEMEGASLGPASPYTSDGTAWCASSLTVPR